MPKKEFVTATHWGNYIVEADDSTLLSVRGTADDENPSPIGQSLINTLDPNCRIKQPMVREGFLKNGRQSDGSGRGREPFVPVSWECALDLAANALAEIKTEHGNQAIYGGSYGWASAGRFHHSQGQIHRFLNQFGGYVASKDSYSLGAGHRLIPHIMGITATEAIYQAVQADEMVDNTELAVCFGGVALKNTQVNASGVGTHTARRKLQDLKAADVRFVNVSPVREDVADFMSADWMPIRPTTDAALMLGLAHTLYTEDLYDKQFVDRYTSGFDQFVPYLTGEIDGQEKNAAWASLICDIPAQKIVDLARDMATKRTLISISWSLQRAEHGEQPWWMGIVLASMLGYVGQKGGGINFGFGSVHNVGFIGRKSINFKIAAIDQGQNQVSHYIPVARIADMLLNPGAEIDYNGTKIVYQDIKAVLWAGGNPFHHHQDLNKLTKAWAKPEVVIVNEIFWNSLARRADILFPATSSLERSDVCASSTDNCITPSQKVTEPYAQARHDYDVYAGLAERLGFGDEFTEGRTADDWVAQFYASTAKNAAEAGVTLPDFDSFMSGGPISLEDQLPAMEYTIENFRDDPDSYPLPGSPNGKIQIYSDVIAGFDYPDCQGHPMWFDKVEWLGGERAALYPLHLVSSQPKTKLHSQWDHGVTSRAAKVKGREVMYIHPDAADVRNLADNDIVRLFNDRGSCLAAVKITSDIRCDVVMLPTGAWYDPEDSKVEGSMDVHGNPNVLTRDAGSSRLSQGCSAHSCLVNVEKYEGVLPAIQVFSLPEIKNVGEVV